MLQQKQTNLLKKLKVIPVKYVVPENFAEFKINTKIWGYAWRGTNHRFNLSDEILIKDNHVKVHKNIKDLVKRAIKNRKGRKITVEVDNINQLKKIIGLKFNRILFDNMNVKNIRKAVKISKKFYETEASGGITLRNVRRIASTGVKRVSVGEITHSVPSVDFKLDFI